MTSDSHTADRSQLQFVQQVRNAFSFLAKQGYTEAEALPTLVRYCKGDTKVEVYHGRSSYEIGCEVITFGIRYTVADFVRVSDPEAAKTYRNPAATTPDGVAIGLKELSALMRRYGAAALLGDTQFISVIEKRRQQWLEEYALDIAEYQLRPQAREAFRRGDYSKAAEMYGRIQERLTATELKKLAFAKKRRKR